MEKNTPNYRIKFPKILSQVQQNEEYCFVNHRGKTIKVFFHDYATIYQLPNLYEQLFCHHLRCRSHDFIPDMLIKNIEIDHVSLEDIRILEIGAGNGLVGESLKKKGIKTIIGIDIIKEALEAIKRDRPEIYDYYIIQDVRCINDEYFREIQIEHPNCLICVSALGFNDISPDAFCHAFNLIADEGFLAINIKNKFLDILDKTGFGQLFKELVERKYLIINNQEEYVHRYSVGGNPLTYVGIIGKKVKSYPYP